ncbi:hypothetical protein T265_09563 [Opisthorchis viverrini]|uniref:Uncharacterized protein n=1 Tax=Opisthorchis viverrini TaxID=6198 RepID=A0A074Z5G4_OPIVI|nr:hypothetical protein T265_09563 [Opisthorchis viverrini]KER22318.1 hypothetical protein T265_09563 [Opisthorchis viverrini]
MNSLKYEYIHILSSTLLKFEPLVLVNTHGQSTVGFALPGAHRICNFSGMSGRCRFPSILTRINCTVTVNDISPKVIIIIDSMTSVFNTNASVPYNHDLFESLTVQKRVKTFIQTIWIETDNKNATDIGWQPYVVVSPTRHSEDHAVPILEGE